MDGRGKACVEVNSDNDEESAEVTWPGEEGSEVELLSPFQADEARTLASKIRLVAMTFLVIARK